MGNTFALPRIRVRSRRRRPRTPLWWFYLGLLIVWLALIAWSVLGSSPELLPGQCCGAVYARRKMRRPECDPEAPTPSQRQLGTDRLLQFAPIGWFVVLIPATAVKAFA